MKRNKLKTKRAVDKFKEYLEQQAAYYGSYEMAIEMEILQQTDPLIIKRLNKLKKDFKGE